jgi:hypothetical protein
MQAPGCRPECRLTPRSGRVSHSLRCGLLGWLTVHPVASLSAGSSAAPAVGFASWEHGRRQVAGPVLGAPLEVGGLHYQFGAVRAGVSGRPPTLTDQLRSQSLLVVNSFHWATSVRNASMTTSFLPFPRGNRTAGAWRPSGAMTVNLLASDGISAAYQRGFRTSRRGPVCKAAAYTSGCEPAKRSRSVCIVFPFLALRVHS